MPFLPKAKDALPSTLAFSTSSINQLLVDRQYHAVTRQLSGLDDVALGFVLALSMGRSARSETGTVEAWWEYGLHLSSNDDPLFGRLLANSQQLGLSL